MTRAKRPWWKTALVWSAWAIGLLVVFVIVASDAVSWRFQAFIGAMILIYAVNSIREQLDLIIWKLDDIERRLPPEPRDYDRFGG